jgi:selenocysteine lyase/cysteine desulfurase
MASLQQDDIRRARDETPGCAGLTHFNNAGAALQPALVTETVIAHLRAESLSGGYEAAADAGDRLDGVYTSLATLLGAEHDDIAITDSATRSWQAIFYALNFEAGDKILTCRSEYASNAISYLQIARRTGAIVEVVDDDESGQLDVADLRRRVDDRVKLITTTHVPTQGGLINPAEKIGEVASEAGIPFLLDACQSVGQLDLDVRRIKCDALSGTGRKYLRGPRGTGFLYVHPRLRERLEPATCTRPSGPRPASTASTPRRAGSSCGKAVSPALLVSARPSTTRSPGAWTRSRSGSLRWARACEQRCATSTA